MNHGLIKNIIAVASLKSKKYTKEYWRIIK